MSKSFDYDKLNTQWEVVSKELIYAAQNGHLDPLGMSEKD